MTRHLALLCALFFLCQITASSQEIKLQLEWQEANDSFPEAKHVEAGPDLKDLPPIYINNEEVKKYRFFNFPYRQSEGNTRYDTIHLFIYWLQQ